MLIFMTEAQRRIATPLAQAIAHESGVAIALEWPAELCVDDVDEVGHAFLDRMDPLRAQGVTDFVIVVPRRFDSQVARLAFWLELDLDPLSYHIDDEVQATPSELARRARDGELPAVTIDSPEFAILDTPRLRLAMPSDEQSIAYYHAIVDTAIFETILWDGPLGPEDLVAFAHRSLRQMARGEGPLSLAIIEKSSEQMVGGISYRPSGHQGNRGDIGYALAPAAQGRGYATEAVARLIEYAFEERDAERIEAEVFVGNDASRRVLEKSGFVLEGTKRRNYRKQDRWRDEWMFSLLRHEWQAAREE